MLTPRRTRFVLIGFGVLGLGLAAALVLNAFRSNLVFFLTPTQVANGEAPTGTLFRIGGLVEPGSLSREPDGLTLQFVMTDTVTRVPVVYQGILPDLFKEGRGAVVQGRLNGAGRFVASEVLAKHDENYMPPEAAEALAKAQTAGEGSGSGRVRIDR